ncbi:hypothetical protein [Halopiger goleimassiliensis]|uniref:hypothetical protein n=1 Tax=Halopiger goleimassiliensis TaxID=1293048 RepID=UPI000677B5B8|nr:hypothetical protein [Halopiger goleimassiliensis]
MGTDDRRPADGSSGDDPDSGLGDAVPGTEATTGYGITLTLIGAVLLALAYYGLEAIQGARQLGQAVPTPFYGLAVAALFVLELLQRGRLSVLTIARGLVLATVYGGLFVLAVEGGAYLSENPAVALEGYAGVTVFAVALVVAAVVYVGYLTVLETDRG